MSEKETNIQYIPVQPIQPDCLEDEIDLRDLVRTIIKYKRMILITTIIMTFLAAIYAYTKTPVYQIEADIQIGFINNSNSNSNSKLYVLDPQATIVFVKNNFNMKNIEKVDFPLVTISLVKKTDNILHLSIQDISNQKAKEDLKKILSTLHQKENKKISSYLTNIDSQIKVLQKQKVNLQQDVTTFNNQLLSIKDPIIYQTTLETISQIKNNIFNIEKQLNNLKNKISPQNIINTHFVGKIKEQDHPIKPKKKLIIIIAFITGLILSIFLVFFLEFVKSFKEEEK